jgi:hypothetical protein
LIFSDIAPIAMIDVFKQGTTRAKKYFRKKAAIEIKECGKCSGKHKLFSGVKPVLFDDIEKAKDWLVNED